MLDGVNFTELPRPQVLDFSQHFADISVLFHVNAKLYSFHRDWLLVFPCVRFMIVCQILVNGVDVFNVDLMLPVKRFFGNDSE